MKGEGRLVVGDLRRVPDELRRRPRWVVWRYVARGRQRRSPTTRRQGGTPAAPTCLTWATFEEACEALEADVYEGVDFVFSSADPYVGVDLDGCRDRETGTLEPWAEEAVRVLDGYAEVSPSGTGFTLSFAARSDETAGAGRLRYTARRGSSR